MGIARVLFGPSKKDEIWRQFAEAIKADFVESSFLQNSMVQAKVKAWTITLDTYRESSGKDRTTYTRMRAPYVNRDGFRFKIFRSSVFSNIGIFFGLQDIEIGYPAFDDAFVIQSNDKVQVRALFANPQIRHLVEAQPKLWLEVRDDRNWDGNRFPENVTELYFQCRGAMKDLAHLKLLYELFAEVLDHLCRIGAATEADPQVKLSKRL